MKQITIYDLLPLLKKGWVAMDGGGQWFWHNKKPVTRLEDGDGLWVVLTGYSCELPVCFNIKPFDGDWKDSLISIDHFHQQGKMVKEEE